MSLCSGRWASQALPSAPASAAAQGSSNRWSGRWLSLARTAAVQRAVEPRNQAAGYLAASLRTVVMLRTVAGRPNVFSNAAPEKVESVILPRTSQ